MSKEYVETMIHHIGSILLVNTLFLLIPGIYGYLIGETSVAKYYIVIGLVVLAIGYLLRRFLNATISLSLGDAVLLTVIAWIIIPFIGGLTLHISTNMPLLDSLFEGVSGFTGTGLTMVTNPDIMPRTVLLWRSIMQWVGGLGVVVISLALFARGVTVARLAVAEGREEKIEPSVKRTIIAMLKIYVYITVIATILLYLAGMNFFDALNHAMTGVGTGGFSTHSLSVGYYSSLSVWYAAIASMVLGAINFVDYSRIRREGFRSFISSIEVRTLLLIAFLGGFITYIVLSKVFTIIDFRLFSESLFHSISALTNTGFQVGDISHYPDIVKVLFVTLMVIGGSTSSTSAGIKIYRLVVFIKSIGWEIKRILLPSRTMFALKVGRKIIDHEVIRKVSLFIVLYITTLLVGSIITAFIYYVNNINVSYTDVLFEVASAQTCTGLSVGLAGPHMPEAAKAVFIVVMLLGRLEIYPFIVAIAKPFIRSA